MISKCLQTTYICRHIKPLLFSLTITMDTRNQLHFTQLTTSPANNKMVTEFHISKCLFFMIWGIVCQVKFCFRPIVEILKGLFMFKKRRKGGKMEWNWITSTCTWPLFSSLKYPWNINPYSECEFEFEFECECACACACVHARTGVSLAKPLESRQN